MLNNNLSKAKNTKLKPTIYKDKYGYSRIWVKNDKGLRKYVLLHRVIAKALIPNPKNLPQVNHLDGNKDNNNPSNLEWCTQSRNMLHAHKHIEGVTKYGSNTSNAKLKEKDILSIRGLLALKVPMKIIGKKYNVSEATIRRVKTGECWSHVK